MAVLIITGAVSGTVLAQAAIEGTIYDENYNPVPLVSIGTIGTVKQYGTQTDDNGYFKFSLPSGRPFIIRVSHIGYETKSISVNLKNDEIKTLNIILTSKESFIDAVTVTAQERGSLVHIDPIVTQAMPGIMGGVEATLMTLPGVRSNNELSSQYSVRGGNIDENLVYVNGIEVYRPFLTRSGNQEGLSFINPNMVSSVQFSSGGFDAKFGDKMSSVLDIKYREPTELFAGSISGNFMGGSLHLEGITREKKFSYLLGLRHKATSYVLKSMEKKGNYKPSFTDFQGLLRWNINSRHTLELFGNIAYNIYNFIPTTRSTTFGSTGDTKIFTVYFDGREQDKFETYMASLSYLYKPKGNYSHKLILSFFNTKESENFDIDSYYRLSDASVADGTVIEGEILGIGHNLNHTRNALDGIFTSLDYQGEYSSPSIVWQWGMRYQYQDIIDRLNEWSLVDSSDYSVPSGPNSTIGDTNNSFTVYPPMLQDVFRSDNNYYAHFFQTYAQARFNFNSGKKYDLCVGLRTFYFYSFSNSKFNGEFFLSPRINFTYSPTLKHETVFRFATGIYAQPPLYKEYRNVYGEISEGVKSQKSLHILAGNDVFVSIWGRQFKLTTDIYYKYLWDLNPYEIDNISVRYMALNSSHGHTGGLDFRFSGEFVEGAESWLSLSFMKASENITYTLDNNVMSSGWVPRPTDQLFAINVFFQDYITRKKNFKVYLNLVFATGLPSGSKDRLKDPSLLQYRGRLRLPSYKRVDIGMSFLLMREERFKNPRNPLHYLKDIWLGIEALNIFQMNNTISYSWIQTLNGGSYSIPNRLTPLQLNIKLEVKF
ncbi:MAG: TonB-dependent receptor [Bacteroidales bacterium]|jgi:hypothetical protein|nr:TonB-dependent receptor [Bacteroidales bacterium]